MLCVQFLHERQDQWKSLSGAEQQVPFPSTVQINAVRSLLLDVKVFDLDSFAPFRVKVLVIGLSWIPYQRSSLSVEAAVLSLQMCEPSVVVGVNVG